MNQSEILTFVTGGNRGMGYEIAKELASKGQHVIIGARDSEKGKLAAAKLSAEGLNVDAIQLDVTDPQSVDRAGEIIKARYGRLTILINNAGAVFDGRQAPSVVAADALHADFDVNYFGLITITQKMIPLLKRSDKAKIINMSSMMGSKTEALNPESEVYRAVAVGYQSAKAAANMYTVQLAKEFQNAQLPITVNAVDPGMVATEFGGVTSEMAKSFGAQPVEFGVARVIELATDFEDDDTATFSNTHGPVAW